MRVDLPKHRVVIRAILGLVQGLGLYALYRTADYKIWPSTDRFVFTPLLVDTVFVPLIFLFGVGNLRARTLIIWGACSTMLLTALAWHAAARVVGENTQSESAVVLLAFSALGVFIAQSLITAGDSDRKIIAAYPRYFDAAWKYAVQTMLAVLFTGLFWLILFLGSALLDLVKLDFLSRLIRREWFSIPVTSLTFASAIHLTDVRVSIISGVRSLIHIVLSWLLPTMAIIVGIFLAGLPFTGLDPLWRTSHAGLLLLAVAGVLTALINTVYRDGTVEQTAPKFLRVGATLGAIELVPIVAIAILAIGLRVDQYGWSVARVFASALAIVAAWHAVGYLFAVARCGPWLKSVERCNIFGAVLVLTTLVGLLTPVADPARIAVADQVARLKSGRVPPEKFDYAYLRWSGERYGKAALQALAADESNAKLTRDGADRALAATSRWAPQLMVLTEAELATAISVYPVGQLLPSSFLRQQWSTENRWLLPQCLSDRSKRCDAFQVDLDGDGTNEIIIAETMSPSRAFVLTMSVDGKWVVAGQLTGGVDCDGVLAALRSGQFSLAVSPTKNLQVAGRTLQLAPSLPDRANCK
jgi:hypothetical protein